MGRGWDGHQLLIEASVLRLSSISFRPGRHEAQSRRSQRKGPSGGGGSIHPRTSRSLGSRVERVVEAHEIPVQVRGGPSDGSLVSVIFIKESPDPDHSSVRVIHSKYSGRNARLLSDERWDRYPRSESRGAGVVAARRALLSPAGPG